MKSFAYLIDPKAKALPIIGSAETTAKNGDMVSYGEWLPEKGVFHEIGRAKISRNKKYNKAYVKMMDGESIYHYDVNYGGGKPI